MSNTVIACQGLCKSFVEGRGNLHVLNKISLEIKRGETIGILGRSGSGKSTLLHLLSGLDTPNAGTVWIEGLAIADLSEKERCRLRNQRLGFVYQFHHLLPEFTALENVSMPLLVGGEKIAIAKKRAQVLLEQIGLGQRLLHKVAELSGGERQRVAIARALVTNPACLLADEPTGNLDKQTADQVFDSMLALNQRLQTSLVIVTHDETLAKRMQRCYLLEQGALTLI